MFTFPILGVRKVIERGKTGAAANGGFRNPYYGIRPGKGEIPGLWMVGDQGVYIMSNGKLADGDRPLVVYSDECHPVGNPDWFHYKHHHFGGDDGIEFIDAERLIPLFDRNFRCTHLHVQLTEASTTEDNETDEVRETHRRPNIQPFLDDPDCWLVASIEDFDIETNTARPGPIFSERVIAPPPAPIITNAADALAVVLNERGHVDPDHIAELLHAQVTEVIEELGQAIFQDPPSGAWQTADAYLSGAVRTKLVAAEAAATLDPAFSRNVAALKAVQPADLRPSDITARLGAPWIPTADIVAFVREVFAADITIHHTPALACWTVNARQLGWSAAGTTEWGTHRRDAGQLLSDALNSSIPQIFDTVKDGDTERRVLNTVETEAAKEKLQKIKTAFQNWIWSDPDRTDRLARLYNDTFNNIAPRAFNGDHLQLPGACCALSLYGHQKRVIWRIISAGSTYAGARPVQWLLDNVDLNADLCLVHATHLDASEIAGAAASGAVAGLCPLTEATMGDGFFPLVEYHGAGGAWGIGTDSHYSTSTAEELRMLECGKRLQLRRRNVIAQSKNGGEAHSGRILFDTALSGGEQASGQGGGGLVAGRRADLVMLDGDSNVLLGHGPQTALDGWLLGGTQNPVRDVMVAGKWVIRDRHHPEETTIAKNYREAMARLAG